MKEGWIRTKDRLPAQFEPVLIYVPSMAPLSTVHEAFLADEKNWWSRLVFHMGEVTHWRPMPDPPREE